MLTRTPDSNVSRAVCAALPFPIRVFWYINVVMAVVCGVVIALNRYVFHLGQGVHWQPYTSPFLPWGHFCDFWNFHDRFDFYHTKQFYSTTAGSIFSYPAPLSLLYAIFFTPKQYEHSIFTVATTIPLFVFLYFLFRAMVRRGISPKTAALFAASSFVFSYPFWFEWELGNIEICVFIIVACGILAWVRGHLYVAAVLLGIAGSMKIFPFVYLALFLSRKQYRQFAAGIMAAVILYPISIWLACPSFAVAIPGIKASSRAMGVGLLPIWDWVLANVDHSLWSFYKQAMHMLGYRNERPLWELSAYVDITAVAGLLAYFFLIRRRPMLNQLMCLSIASILLPPMSNDYTLLYLYLPWGLLILSTIDGCRVGKLRPGTLTAFVCFGFLMSAESEIVIHGAAIAGQFKAILLLVLFYIALKYPFDLPSDARAQEIETQAPALSELTA